MFLNNAAVSPELSVHTEPRTAPLILITEFVRVASPVFSASVERFRQDNPDAARDIELLASYNQAECWMRNSGEAGFAITSDFELVNLFSRRAGYGSSALKFAQARYSNISLNCYEGSLEKFYARHGFEVVRQEENWFSTPEQRLPQVVFMSWNKG